MPKNQLLKNMKFFVKNNKLLSISLFILVVLIPGLVFAYTAYTGYRVNPGETITIQYYDSSGNVSPISYHVVNPPYASKSYFLPTRTIGEFNALYNNYTWDDSSTNSLSLEDYCGNGLCGYCVNANSSGTTAERLKAIPNATNLRFVGYSYACEEQSDCPQDCGSIYCGDGTCEPDGYYENSTICPHDCQSCSSNDFAGCTYYYSCTKGSCSCGWDESYINHGCH